MIVLFVMYGVDGILDVIVFVEMFDFVIDVIKYDESFVVVIVGFVVVELCLVDECFCIFSDDVFFVVLNDLGVDGFFLENLMFFECKKNVVQI